MKKKASKKKNEIKKNKKIKIYFFVFQRRVAKLKKKKSDQSLE